MGPDGQNKTMMSNKKQKKTEFPKNIFQKYIFQNIFFIFLFFQTFYLIFFAFKILKIVQNGPAVAELIAYFFN